MLPFAVNITLIFLAESIKGGILLIDIKWSSWSDNRRTWHFAVFLKVVMVIEIQGETGFALGHLKVRN